MCYVATTGNKALASLLLENGANTKLATNIGDTPTSIALTAGYTSLASVLDGKTVAPPTNPDDGSCTNPLIEGSGSLEARLVFLVCQLVYVYMIVLYSGFFL